MYIYKYILRPESSLLIRCCMGLIEFGFGFVLLFVFAQ